MTKPRFTLEQHTELGRPLAGMKNRMVDQVTKLQNAYPLQTEAMKSVERAMKQLDTARREMETLLCHERPNDPDVIYVYCPHPEDRVTNFD